MPSRLLILLFTTIPGISIGFSRKDHLFTPIILETGSTYRLISYSQQRDLFGRDIIPVHRAHDQYVDTKINIFETLGWHNGLGYHEIGFGHEFVVIFIHGLGGHRGRGWNDWSFGGNFNRLKNLAVRFNGRYISPDIPSFQAGASHIAGIIAEQRRDHPTKKVILACGSSGGRVCWDLYARTDIPLDGLILLGSTFPSRAILNRRSIPVFWGHGTADTSIPHGPLQRFVASINDRPVMLDLYETGVHGTPLRMIDWAWTLTWISSHRTQ
ncbi:MAG: hypothetical protein NZL83_03555 [Candidatus Absconditabacterales bacterium]|nr:hypothetical protein [Candidatus Absconditabacterales bacterium]